ncbi:MAG TPA: glutamine amidotransferase [Blastocatellia bacterium]|nr:glutamine amidotransferase [Blastocatellia bacterium]
MEQVVSFLFKYNGALFSKSQFGFGGRPSLLIVLMLAALICGLLYFLYATPKLALPPKWRAALIAIRLALLVVIVLCIMRPVIVVPSVLPQSSYVAVLMDDSSSMKLAGDGSGSRLDAVKQLMSSGDKFYAALADKFKLREFKFTASAERINDAKELTGEGEQTNLAGAIDQASREAAGLPLSGIIVVSDGAANAGVNGEGDATSSLDVTLGSLRARGVPVYTIGVGQTRLDDDVELTRATAPRRVLAGSMVTAELLLRAGARKTVKVELSEDNHLLRTLDVAVQGDATTVARASFTPSSPGLHRYKFTAVPSPDEPVQDNNSQELLIDVEDGRPRILYVEGEPRWEYGKLRAAVAEEKNVILVSVLRSADGKFYRQGIENADELAGGFPKSEEDLFKYDAVMIGSVEATFFTFDQLKALEQFVSRRGGALLALGGAKSFNAGGYSTTPLADLLPVYLSGTPAAGGEVEDFKAAPADRGRDHPAARLAEQSDANAKAWDQMPAITLPEAINDTKPGATVILEARSLRDKSRVSPLLVEERYGRGRTLALLASDTWRWRMMLDSKNTSFETFWRNLLRYLVDGVRQKVEASAERSFYGSGEAVRIRAEVADEKFISINDAQVTAHVTAPSGRVIDVSLKQTVDSGFEGYAAPFRPEEDGLYRVEVTAKRPGSKQGAVVMTAPANTSFLVGPVNREAWNAAQNRELLERVASETGGKYYTTDHADKVIEDLTHREAPGSIRETKDLWDMPFNFLLVLVLASGEWFIRKRKGLA